ncbi:MAG: hypothetical protein WAS73_14295 [Defluviicoccus sp.]
MIDYDQMGRVLYRHEWSSLNEWVDSLNDLAAMSDAEIGLLCKCAVPGTESRVSPLPRSLRDCR